MNASTSGRMCCLSGTALHRSSQIGCVGTWRLSRNDSLNSLPLRPCLLQSLKTTAGWRAPPFPKRRQGLVVRASNEEATGKDDQRKLQQDKLVEMVTVSVGLTGTIALVLGHFLDVEPLGHLHWDTRDIILGLECIIPVLILDAMLMLPDYSATSARPQMNVPSATAPASITIIDTDNNTPADEDMGTPPPASGGVVSTVNGMARRRMSAGRKTRSPVTGALHRLQQSKIFNNAGLGLGVTAEYIALLPVHLAEEMLNRAVILAGVSKWLVDRLYEGDIEEVVHMGPVDLAPPELAAWLTLAFGAVALGLLSLRKMVATSPDFRVVVSKNDGDVEEPRPAKPVTESASKAQKILHEVSLRHRYLVCFQAIHSMTEWVSLGAAFILTGNLAAPLAGAVVADGLFSFYQRYKLKAAVEAQNRQLKEMVMLFKEINGMKASLKTTPDDKLGEDNSKASGQ